MDGIHDLGGKQGHGPVPVVAGDVPYTHDWEMRMWALAMTDGLNRGMAIDWFRHGVERMVPADYLTFSYMEKWVALYFMALIDNGTFTFDEVLAGNTDRQDDPPPAQTLQEVLESHRGEDFSFARKIAAPPAHSVGDTVFTKSHGTAAHTRLPQYARGRTGTVIAHHGAHLLPDRGAEGIELAELLYTVEFTAAELWGDDTHPKDTVTLELWESYLV